MASPLRRSGIEPFGEMPWGTHICQFYDTSQDLIEILVPYFKAGLEQNEFCMWVTAEPLNRDEAERAMLQEMPDFHDYLTSGQIEILPYTDWYLRDGHIDLQRVLDGWVDKLNSALAMGYAGMRVSGNTTWLESHDWTDFTAYEAAINDVIGKYKMLALCTYRLDRCNARNVMDVIRNHQFALLKHQGGWELVESAFYKRTKEALAQERDKMKAAESRRTVELRKATEELREEALGRRQAERGAEKAREYAASIVETMRESLVVLDAELRVISANRSFYEIFKMTPEETEGRFLYELGNGQWDIPRLRQLLEDILPKNTQLRGFEAERDFQAIGHKAMLLNARRIYKDAKKTEMILLAIEDITEAKRAGEALLASNERYRTLFEQVPIAIYEEDWSAVKKYVDELKSQGVVDFRGYFQNRPEAVAHAVQLVRVTDVNEAALKLYEAGSKGELLKGLEQIFGKETYDVFIEEIIALAEGHRLFEAEAMTRTLRGKENCVYLTLSVAPGHEGSWSRVLLSLADITDHKQAEAALRESRQFLQKLNDSLQEVIFTVRLPERAIVYANRCMRDVFGYEPGEFIGKNTDFLYASAEEYVGFGEKVRSVLLEGRDALHTEQLFRRKTGEVFPGEITCTFLKEDGEITQSITVLRDITRRKRAEQKMHLSESRLAEAQRIAHVGNWDWNIVTNELLWSDEIYRIFGLAPQEFGATYDAFLERVHPEDRTLVTESVDAALYEGKPYSIDHRIMLKDGTVRFVHEQGEVTLDQDGKPLRMLGTVQDISERKLAEEQLRTLSRRLVQIQEEERRSVARELHDEVGQVLTALKLSLDRVRLDPEDESGSDLIQARETVRELIQEIRSLSLSLRPAMLDDLGLLPTLQWYFGRYTPQTGVRVNFRHAGLQNKLPPEVCTAAYRVVQEALTNVARHARVGEAMVCLRADEEHLIIEVEDRGVGFDMAKTPSYATAGVGGMRERVMALNGEFSILSSPGSGTYLLADLPLPGQQAKPDNTAVRRRTVNHPAPL